jgi:two-component sensor histidine kinase
VTEFEIHPPNLGEHVLLHELNHRINNEFAAAIGVVSAAASRSNNPKVKAALTGVRELLHRYADVHRALQMPEDDAPLDLAAYIQRLCVSISRSKLEDREIKLVLSVQSLPLQAYQCWRLGMIVYELITNAARHVFDRISDIVERAYLSRVSSVHMSLAGTQNGLRGLYGLMMSWS